MKTAWSGEIGIRTLATTTTSAGHETDRPTPSERITTIVGRLCWLAASGKRSRGLQRPGLEHGRGGCSGRCSTAAHGRRWPEVACAGPPSKIGCRKPKIRFEKRHVDTDT